MEIPAFMLKKLYRKGSLKNSAEGASFAVKNTISPATITGLEMVKIDGETYLPKKIELLAGGVRIAADKLSPESPLQVAQNEEIIVSLPGVTLAPGAHKLLLNINTREVGPLTLEVGDTVV